MTTDVVSVHRAITVRSALVLILNGNVERAPVVDEENKLVGIVTQHDILLGHQKLMAQFSELAQNLH